LWPDFAGLQPGMIDHRSDLASCRGLISVPSINMAWINRFFNCPTVTAFFEFLLYNLKYYT
jgi:hypothetical protein